MNTCPFCSKRFSKKHSNKHHLSPGWMLSRDIKEAINKERPDITGKLYTTVKGCKSCHEKIKLDEEYFITRVLWNKNQDNFPRAKHLRKYQLVNWSNGHETSLRNNMIKDSYSIQTSKGIPIKIDRKRLNNYLTYLVKGLYYKAHGKVLSNKKLDCFIDDELDDQCHENFIEALLLWSKIPDNQKINSRAVLGDFEYGTFQMESMSVWFLRFWRQVFIIVTKD